MEPGYRDRAPRFIVEPDGKERVVVEGFEKVNERGFGGLGAYGQKTTNQLRPYVSGRRGGFDPHARIHDMDQEAIDAAFLYPTLGLFFGGLKDPNLSAAICRAYNRWLIDYCKPYPDRLFGIAMLPMQSVELAIDEMKYAREVLGMHGGFLRPNPYQGRTLHHPDYDRFWAQAQDLDFSIGLHGGVESGGMPAVGVDRFEGRVAKHVAAHTMEMMLASLSVIMCGVCERFPALRFGFLESGGGWIAGWLDRMDRHFDDTERADVLRDKNDFKLSMRPSEYFRRQCWISFEPVEGCLSYLADYIGPEKILWATDYPHGDGFPGAPELILKRPELSEETKRKILAEGAIRFYKLV